MGSYTDAVNQSGPSCSCRINKNKNKKSEYKHIILGMNFGSRDLSIIYTTHIAMLKDSTVVLYRVFTKCLETVIYD